MKRFAHWVWVVLMASMMSGCAGIGREGPPSWSWQGEAAMTVLEQRTPKVAQRYLGLPYRYAANPDKEGATDCSHLVSAVTRNSLEGTPYRFQPYYLSTAEITRRTVAVSRPQVRAGDLVIFKQDKGSQSENHSGLVTRVEGDVIHFVHASATVGVQELSTTSNGWTKYWASRLHSFRRWKPDTLVMAKN